MPQITRQLLRKRAEHNEGMISTLEEISLHQEELESINDVLATTCRKIKILYLQNNIIAKMENLYHMKDLTYLNLALNNITKIEGLQNCEFLRKLDLTVNFIDFDTLAESMENLKSRLNLEELYMMGNPAEGNWPNFPYYVIAQLPQLLTLDGKEITKTMRIKARQMLPALEVELSQLAGPARARRAARAATEAATATANNITTKPKKESRVVNLDDPEDVQVEDVDEEEDEEDGYNGNEMTENTPEDRVKIYKELAQQKKDKEERANVNAPKERNYEREQAESISDIRSKEQQTFDEKEIKQKNEGGYEFVWDEDTKPGYLSLEVMVPKHMDSSLIDVDVHPTYVSVIIKSKVLRLRLPCEIKAGDSKCQRSKTTGGLLILMPKINPKETLSLISKEAYKQQAKQQQQGHGHSHTVPSTVFSAATDSATTVTTPSTSNTDRIRHKTTTKKLSLQEMMLQEATGNTIPTSNPTTGTGSTGGSGGGGKLDDQIGQKTSSGGGSVVRPSSLYVTKQGKENLLQQQQPQAQAQVQGQVQGVADTFTASPSISAID